METESLEHREADTMGRYLVGLTAALFLLCVLIPMWAPRWFVPATGHVKIAGLGLSAVVVLGLLGRINVIRYVSVFLFAMNVWLSWKWMTATMPFLIQSGDRPRGGWILVFVMSIAGSAILLLVPSVRLYFRKGV